MDNACGASANAHLALAVSEIFVRKDESLNPMRRKNIRVEQPNYCDVVGRELPRLGCLYRLLRHNLDFPSFGTIYAREAESVCTWVWSPTCEGSTPSEFTTFR